MLILFVVAFGLLWILSWTHRRVIRYGNLSVRGSLVLAYVAFQVIVLVITEVSSIGRNLTSGVVEASWLVVVLTLLIAARRPLLQLIDRMKRSVETREGIRVRLNRSGLNSEEWIWLGVVAAIFTVLAVVAYLYPPNNADAMAYHLAHVEHWIQNRTIAPFATHYLAQVELSPLAEYFQTHLHLLSGSDRFDASGELLACLVSVIGVTELARLLGASRWAQVMSAVICATIPSGILLATSAENDYVAAATSLALLVLLAGFTFGRNWMCQSLIIGVAAALTYMTKGDVPLMVGPAALGLLALAIYRLWRIRGWTKAILSLSKRLLAMVIGATAVALPFLVQNIQLFGSVAGPVSRGTLSTPETFNGAAANIVRSTSSNFDIGNGVSGLDTTVARIILGPLGHLYSAFGISPNNFHYTITPNYNSFQAADFSELSLFDAVGANPWHVLLMVASIVVLIVAVRRGASSLRTALVLATALTIGFLLFSGLARWSPDNVRYAMPLLVAWSAVIALALDRFPRWVGRVVMIGLVVVCIPQLLDNGARPLVPPKSNHGNYLASYFYSGVTADQVRAAESYESITTMIKESTCTHVGLGNMIELEYPIWVALGHDHWHGTIDDYNVKNVSAKLEPSYRPCAVISQQNRHYVTPNNGTANGQFFDLAVSINVSNAGTIRTSIPNFTSSAPGVRLLPGGGWALSAFGSLPILQGNGSLYLFSETSQRVTLELPLVTSVDRPAFAIQAAHGQSDEPITTDNAVRVDLHLHSGTNRVNLVTTPSTVTRQLLVFRRLSVVPVSS